jgi:Tol biopolymer transport system component
VRRTAPLLLASVALTVLLALAGPAQATFPGQNGRIAFDRAPRGESDLEIYTMRPDGAGLRRITFNARYDYDPAWSSDGSKISFIHVAADHSREIWVKNVRTRQTTRIADRAIGEDPAWSPDGSKIAFKGFYEESPAVFNVDIFVINADGSGLKRLTTQPGADSGPAWSPDGSKIAFESYRDGNYDIYAMNADGSGQAALTEIPTSEGGGAAYPNWSPDGSKIAYTVASATGTPDADSDIWVMNSDGSNETDVTRTSRATEDRPAWSPDGKKIVFESYGPDGAFDIWKMNADGTNRRNLTNTPTARNNDFRPDWQPRPPTAG